MKTLILITSYIVVLILPDSFNFNRKDKANIGGICAKKRRSGSAKKELNIMDMGAVPDNAAFDNSVIINKCFQIADSRDMTVFVPGNTFYVSKSVILTNAGMTGVKGKSKLIITPGFTFSSEFDNKEKAAGQKIACISNAHYSQEFNNSTADKIYISNIIFELNLVSVPRHDEGKLLALANVNEGVINDCVFRINKGLPINATCIDLFAAVKNLKIKNCNIENLNESDHGGGMWIRNFPVVTGGVDNKANDTENIIVDSCHFKHATEDETLSVFGSTGEVKNIEISNTDFIALPSSRKHNVFVSVFPMNKPNRPFAATRDVIFDNCVFNDANFNFYVFRCGSYSDDKVCGNVTVKNSKFIVSKSALEVVAWNAKKHGSIIAKNLKSVGGENVFLNNTIIVNAGQGIDFAIGGFDTVANCNVVKGTLLNVFNNCKSLVNNKIN